MPSCFHPWTHSLSLSLEWAVVAAWRHYWAVECWPRKGRQRSSAQLPWTGPLHPPSLSPSLTDLLPDIHGSAVLRCATSRHGLTALKFAANKSRARKPRAGRCRRKCRDTRGCGCWILQPPSLMAKKRDFATDSRPAMNQPNRRCSILFFPRIGQPGGGKFKSIDRGRIWRKLPPSFGILCKIVQLHLYY